MAEDNQIHLNGCEKDGDPEESHLIPDAQVNGVVFLKKIPETHLSGAKSCIITRRKNLYLIIVKKQTPLDTNELYNDSKTPQRKLQPHIVFSFDCKRIYAVKETNVKALDAMFFM